MKIRCIFGGSPQSNEAATFITRYSERLNYTEDITITYIESKANDPQKKRSEESKKILATIPNHAAVVVCDERGKEMSSEKFAKTLERAENDSKELCIIVGGAHGVDETVRARADILLALSPMIFPHELARVMILEQLYRARGITHGSKYHHAG